MKLFRWGKRRKQGIVWEYRSDSTLWRIYPTESPRMVVEERDLEKKKSKFTCLNRLDGKVAWSKPLLDDWWVGVEAITSGVVVLHGFAAPDMPIHKGITVVDLGSGDIRWGKPDLSFERLGEKSIVGSRGAYGNREFTMLELGSGTVLRVWSEGEESSFPDKQSGGIPQTVRFPITINGQEEIPDMVREILQKPGVKRPASWLRVGQYTVVSFPKGEPGHSMIQELSVTRADDGSVFFSDQVATGTVNPDSFLAQDEMLYYVRAGRELIALDLHTGKGQA